MEFRLIHSAGPTKGAAPRSCNFINYVLLVASRLQLRTPRLPKFFNVLKFRT